MFPSNTPLPQTVPANIYIYSHNNNPNPNQNHPHHPAQGNQTSLRHQPTITSKMEPSPESRRDSLGPRRNGVGLARAQTPAPENGGPESPNSRELCAGAGARCGSSPPGGRKNPQMH